MTRSARLCGDFVNGADDTGALQGIIPGRAFAGLVLVLPAVSGARVPG